MGFYATGLAVADIDGDGYADLVVASGNDKGLQNLAVYSNNGRGGFPDRPDWLSDDIDANANLAVGDIDGDGAPDVAVSVISGREGLGKDFSGLSGGRVKVYFNRVGPGGKRELEKRPSYSTEDRFGSFGCALADVDGDGDLDLVASSSAEDGHLEGSLRIYLNDHHKLSTRPSWRSEEKMLAGAPKVADLDQDGLLDVAVGAERVRVYRASLDAGSAVRFGRTASFTSREGGYTATYLDAGRVGSDPRPGLVVSYNDVCYRNGSKCGSSRVEVYRLPDPNPAWRSDDGGLGAGVALADLDGDGRTDLIAGRWGITGTEGAPLVIYKGDERAFSSAPAFVSGTRSVVEAVAVGSLTRHEGALPVAEESFTITRPQAVVTLSRQVIAAIREVTRNGAKVPSNEYARVPGESWISFARRLGHGDRITVRYAYVDAPFFAGDKGSFVFLQGSKGKVKR
jgi:hypothetical protein